MREKMGIPMSNQKEARSGRSLLARNLAAGLLVVLLALWAAPACGDDGEPSAPGSPGAGEPLKEGQVRITAYGHSMFTIESSGGVVILTDPNKDIGYRAPPGPIDLVTVSHDHFDHNKVEVAPDARVLHGLTEEGDWAQIDERVGDVNIRTFPSFHDGSQGAERGKNAMFLFEVGNLRILHAGDLGHPLDPSTIQELGRIDVLLVPVGGHFTIGPQEAASLVRTLGPTFVIPMHYRTDSLKDFPEAKELRPVGEFQSAARDTIARIKILNPGDAFTIEARR